MKKRTMYILCLSAVVTVCTFKAFAASYHEPIQVEGPTINFDVESEVQAQQYVDKSNLQDGDRIITVKQAKEIEKASYLEDED